MAVSLKIERSQYILIISCENVTYLNALKLAIIKKYFWFKLDVEKYDQNVSSYLNYFEIQTFILFLYRNVTDLIKFPLFRLFVYIHVVQLNIDCFLAFQVFLSNPVESEIQCVIFVRLRTSH